MKYKALVSFLAVVCALLVVGEAHAQSRISYSAGKSSRGSTINISESVIETYCGDFDGCTIRLGMNDWDGTGRTASREFLFYYNNSNRNWRASNDAAGRNDDNTTQHVYQAWACYFTDGYYTDWTNNGDYNTYFGLLSWNQYDANCYITIID
jgi:hypothetical protein